MTTLTKDQKRAKKNKAQQKKLTTKEHEQNKISNQLIAVNNSIVGRKNPNTKIKPDYKSLVSSFSGSMKQWDELVLKTHNAFGYGFDYEDLVDAIINKITEALPSSAHIFNRDQEKHVEDLVKKLEEKYENQLIEMLSTTDKQSKAYWSGELEEEGILDYGFV